MAHGQLLSFILARQHQKVADLCIMQYNSADMGGKVGNKEA